MLYPACCHPLQLPPREWPSQVIFDAIHCLLPPPAAHAAPKIVPITCYIWCYTLLVATPSSCPLESAQHRLYLMLYPACCHPLQLPLRECPAQVIFDAIPCLFPAAATAPRRVARSGLIWPPAPPGTRRLYRKISAYNICSRGWSVWHTWRGLVSLWRTRTHHSAAIIRCNLCTMPPWWRTTACDAFRKHKRRWSWWFVSDLFCACLRQCLLHSFVEVQKQSILWRSSERYYLLPTPSGSVFSRFQNNIILYMAQKLHVWCIDFDPWGNMFDPDDTQGELPGRYHATHKGSRLHAFTIARVFEILSAWPLVSTDNTTCEHYPFMWLPSTYHVLTGVVKLGNLSFIAMTTTNFFRWPVNSLRQVTHICVSKLAIIGSGNGLRLVGAKPLPEPMLVYC